MWRVLKAAGPLSATMMGGAMGRSASMAVLAKPVSPLFRPLFAQSIPAISIMGQPLQQQQQQARSFHIRHTYEVNQNAKRGLTDASFELRKLLREDKIFSTGRERRVKPTQERKEREQKYIYNIEKRARKQIIKYIMSKIEARKKAKVQ